MKAHQLIHYGKTHCSSFDADHANYLLFQAQYENGKNLSLLDDLMEIASEHYGQLLDLDDLRDYLANNRGASQVQDEIRSGRRAYGIKSVPFFVVCVDGKTPYGFSGAQSKDVFLQVFDELTDSIS